MLTGVPGLTRVYKLHFMRVGSDGTSSDVVAQQWTHSESTVYAPTPGDSSNYADVQAGPPINLSGVFMITNADQGAVFSWSVTKLGYCALATDTGCTAQVDTVNENHITTMAAGTITGDVILNWALPGQFEAVQPVLQLADGSFIGTVNGQTGGNMLAFNSSGNVSWVVPNFTPQMATADGGIIASAPQVCNGNGCTPGTVSTFDPNGNPTGEVPPLPTYSWKGTYQLGSIRSLLSAWPVLTKTYAAVFGQNLTGNGTAVVQHTIGAFWCGPAFDGSCSGLSDSKGVALIDLGFYYGTAVLVPSQGGAPPPNVYDFTSAHPDWVNTIHGQTMAAMKQAFERFPVIVVEKSLTQPSWIGRVLFGQTPTLDVVSDPTVIISGNLLITRAGLTNEPLSPSWVYYGSSVNGAQTTDPALESQLPADPSQSMTAQQLTAFQIVLRRIGLGIGNVAAHEVAHQFALPFMDCDKPADPTTTPPTPAGPPCPAEAGNPPHNTLYEYYDGQLPMYKYLGPPLHWFSQDAANFVKALLKR